MSIFKRTTKYKKLLQRVESLESDLGLFYTVDSDNYAEHKQEKGGYGSLARLDDRVKELEKKGKK